MSTQLLSLIGWTFLPSLVTGWVQSIYYGVAIRAGDPKPAPNTPRHAEHRRRIHILVVTLYLLYTIYEAHYDLQRASTFYTDLGVPPGASEKDVKSRFRRLAALHHPDKQGPGAAAGGDNSNAGDLFMHLKTAADVLTDPARRFAYERFGPDVVAWQRCATVHDYVVRGVQTALAPHYLAAAAFMYALGLLGYLQFGRYWRWLTLAALLVFELHAVTRPRFPLVVDRLLNPLLARLPGRHAPYLPFQAVSLARKLCITIYIAFNQLGPLLQPRDGRRGGGGEETSSEKALLQALDRLEQTARGVDSDAARLMDLELTPFAGDPEVLDSLRPKMKEWLVQNTIRNDPMVRDALGRSYEKRRIDAPTGAKGNR
ncbi:hypothetical protein DL767_009456 [Monosporascus sp. MG133]|nr:hypothetical protein DL767_009456 [Monosporascus sp. MG133]